MWMQRFLQFFSLTPRFIAKFHELNLLFVQLVIKRSIYCFNTIDLTVLRDSFAPKKNNIGEIVKQNIRSRVGKKDLNNNKSFGII